MSNTSQTPQFVPSPEIAAAIHQIQKRVTVLRSALSEGLYQEIAGNFGAELLCQQFKLINAQEGTVWLLNQQQTHLVPVWNNGAWAAHFVGKHLQSIDKGLVSMVCQTETAFCEDQVNLHMGQDKSVDGLTGRITCSMAIVPLICGGGVCGVLSAVKTKAPEDADPPPFADNTTEQLALAGSALGAWLDAALFARALGLGMS